MKGDDVIGMVTSTTDFAYAISAVSIREFLRGARGGEIVLSNLEKWQRANWRKAYEARLKEMAVFPEQPAVLEEKLPEGMIMAFATAPGGIASDGEDQHGPYTKYLLQEMQKSQKIEEVFQKVSKSVRKTTNGKQVPWYNTSLSSGNFCFGGCSRTSSKLVKQLALVIGNANYSRAPLKNTINDAQAIAKVLVEKGFEVILQTGLDFSEMTRAIWEFAKRLSVENGVGLFYFSGHSVQIDGEEYLTPVDFNFENHHERWKYNMVSVDSIVKQMQSANSKLNIIILDSSRADPFLR